MNIEKDINHFHKKVLLKILNLWKKIILLKVYMKVRHQDKNQIEIYIKNIKGVYHNLHQDLIDQIEKMMM